MGNSPTSWVAALQLIENEKVKKRR